jgi:hypothetical protein
MRSGRISRILEPNPSRVLGPQMIKTLVRSSVRSPVSPEVLLARPPAGPGRAPGGPAYHDAGSPSRSDGPFRCGSGRSSGYLYGAAAGSFAVSFASRDHSQFWRPLPEREIGEATCAFASQAHVPLPARTVGVGAEDGTADGLVAAGGRRPGAGRPAADQRAGGAPGQHRRCHDRNGVASGPGMTMGDLGRLACLRPDIPAAWLRSHWPPAAASRSGSGSEGNPAGRVRRRRASAFVMAGAITRRGPSS